MRGLDRWERGILALLAAAALAPLVVVLVRSLGDDSWLGAVSRSPADQLQYLAWIRESGEHGLADNRFGLMPSDKVFLHPMFALSGLAWKLGLDIRWAFVLWTPVAVAALFAGFAAYVRRLEPPGWWRRAALFLALFAFTPAAALVRLVDLGGTQGREDIGLMGAELFSAGRLWGYLPAALAMGLVPLALLGAERMVDASKRSPGRSLGWYAACTSAAGATAAWLHPWQGELLLGVLAGGVAWGLAGGRGLRRYVPLAWPALAAAAPLAYYFALGQADPAWELAQERSGGDPAHYVPLVVAAGLLPLAAFAVAGAAAPARDEQERMLRLWPLVALLVYAFSPSSAYHAFNGLALPLAILSVRGWRRLGLHRAGAPGRALALAASAALIAPAVVHGARVLRDQPIDPPHLLEDGEMRALRALDAAEGDGGVLSSYRTGTAVPAFSGRGTWLGHTAWTPDWDRRVQTSLALFGGRLEPAQAREVVSGSGARWALADCRSSVDLERLLGSAIASSRRFGCATLYELAPRPG